MRYFTRGFTNGELDDDESDRVVAAYRQRLVDIAPRLAGAMLQLARDVDVHDAIIESVQWTPDSNELAVTLVAGAGERGCRSIALAYTGARLGRERIESLRRAALHRETQVLYREVDVDDDGLMVHRLLFWPCEEVTIEFDALRLDVAVREDSRVRLRGAFVESQSRDEATS